MFYACFTLIGSWEGKKNFRVGNILNKNLLGLGYRKNKQLFLGLINNKNKSCKKLHFYHMGDRSMILFRILNMRTYFLVDKLPYSALSCLESIL